jgi:uncharacterized protein YndB with AHSA1/START domain
MLLMSDSITRELVLPAPPDVVWAKSFGSPDALTSWFPEHIEGDFTLHGEFFLIWGEHRCQCRMVEFQAPHTLAYQWHPGDTNLLDQYPESELTTVRFTLEPHGEHTKVTIHESGFANISVDRRDHCITENNEGWDSELAKLLPTYA